MTERWIETPELNEALRVAIARRHLQAPQEWGERSYDEGDLAERMGRGWGRQGDELLLRAAVEAGEVLAFIWAELIAEPERCVHIRSLWVSPQRRRRGWARALKLAAEDWGRSAGALSISSEVHPGNAAMLALNADLGYETIRVEQRKAL